MSASLDSVFARLIEQTPTTFYRSQYGQFNLKSRLTGLVGPRGVGKTTLLLQYIKQALCDRDDVFYFSVDHIFFSQTTIYDYVENLYLTRATRILFIDEIHRYKNWCQELKNLYDGFPDLTIVFSGSSSLDLVKGSYDLSRRAKMVYLPGLSFREYVNLHTDYQLEAIDFASLIHKPNKLSKKISQIPKLMGMFKAYLAEGYYPFQAEDKLDYYQRILRIVAKTIDEDITNFYNLKTENLIYFRKILLYLASIPPGEISVNNIANNLGIDAKTVLSYLTMLEETGLTHSLYSVEIGNRGLKRPSKLFLNNTSLLYAIERDIGADVQMGTVRELFFIQMLKNAGVDVYYSKVGDYMADKTIFEIGGKNKKHRQIKGASSAFLVKDEILIPYGNEIPLLFFGFLY